MDLKGKVVVITGAAGALGSEVARVFARAGARLALVDRVEEPLIELAGEIGGEALPLGGVDLTDEDSVGELAARVMAHYGRVDVLLNIAGGYRAGTPVHETPLAIWDFMLNLNARTVLLTARAFVPHLIAGGGGRIVSVASRSALEANRGDAAYAASKSAVMRLTESLAKELGQHRIAANCIIPAAIDTPANRKSMPGADFSKWVQPEQIAQVLLFLASDASAAVTGAAIPVYGFGMV
ncbi:MAG: SDR family NAD(P)-dependent oxidoreductase [Anaerolineae bacterium]